MSSTLREASKDTLQAKDKTYHYYSLPLAAKSLGDITRLPKSLKVLLENLLRWQDGNSVTEEDIHALAGWLKNAHADREIAYRPARVLMQDFTGVPAVVDLAAMREAVKRLGGDTAKVNPLSPVDLVIDHSVTVDRFGDDEAFEENVRLEMERNHERYVFLKWGKQAFSRFSVVPPGTGICHQVNLEYLGKAVWSELQDGEWIAYPDTLVGTDSHTTMINGLGVVGKFVEFYGDGLDSLPLADRATIANMSPEYGATCGFFPIDAVTLDYMRLSGRSEDQVELVEKYAKAQGMWRNPGDEPIFTSMLELDMNDVEASLAGPKRPQDRVALPDVPKAFAASNELEVNATHKDRQPVDYVMNGHQYQLPDGAVVIAAITSCTNTSNPSVLMAAGLLAKKAVTLGLKRQPWVKASLAPGSKVVSDYLAKAKLTPYLDELGFNLVGYGCTTCIGNSGPLPDPIETAIKKGDLTVGAVLSGNRNFEGRIHPLVKTNWLASPPLVVAYALAGNMNINLASEPIGHDRKGDPVYLKDIWPSAQEIARAVEQVSTEMFRKEYAEVFEGTAEWKEINVTRSDTYGWQEDSTYIRLSPFFDEMQATPAPVEDIHGARILAMLGDSVTTDHISPAGSIKPDSPAGRYLQGRGVERKDFNSYGSRRGNHEVMMRGTFANIRIRNEMVPGVEGGMTRHLPDSDVVSIYDAAMRYKQEQTPLAVIAGKEYGSGSSRDWAAKGPRLLGIRVVIAESFERIHRSNLIGMGILPLEFPQGVTRKTLGLTGEEKIDIGDLQNLQPGATVPVTLTRADGSQEVVPCRCRIDTATELTYYQNDGILHYVIRNMLK
ncbi:aconitate hydratase AcnA [Escherichia coli]|nr:aconitate hydratase AcnA [Escherichia coli]